MPAPKKNIRAVRNDGVVATIVRSEEGGPLRRIITGRKTKPTATVPCLKSGFRNMPVESMKCELPTLQISEVATAVHALMSQSHRLEIYIEGEDAPLIYFPDLELEVEPQFLQNIQRGVPFAEAASHRLLGTPSRLCKKLVVEVKDDDDPRNCDEVYQEKLELARQAYRMKGIHFIVIRRSVDLKPSLLATFVPIALNAMTSVDARHSAIAVAVLGSEGVGHYGRLLEAFGGGPRGEATLHALQVRRVISIDLRSPITGASVVSIVRQ